MGLVLFSARVFAQNPESRIPTSKEIGEVINALKAQNLLPAASHVLVFGETRSPSLLKNQKGKLSLTQAVATIGGLSRNAAKNILIIGKNKSGIYQTKLVADFSEIKLGKRKDVILEGGDVVIVLTGKPISIPLFPTQIPKGIPAPYKPRPNDA